MTLRTCDKRYCIDGANYCGSLQMGFHNSDFNQDRFVGYNCVRLNAHKSHELLIERKLQLGYTL